MKSVRARVRAVLVATMTSAVFDALLAQGIVPPGAGPILRSFGGTAIAAPLDGVGALYWNPATMSFLDRRIDAGAEAFWKNQSVESTIPANLFAPGNPPAAVTGKTKSNDGMSLAPASTAIYRAQNATPSKLTLGAGLFAYSGGGSNYPADPGNPTLAGLGGWYNNFVIVALPLGASYKVNNNLALGAAIDLAQVMWTWSRAIFASPERATVNGKTVISYPSGIGNPEYGAGIHLGAYHHSNSGLGLGLMLKSPIWFQWLDYHTSTLENGERTIGVKTNTPAFIGAGVSYDGRKQWLFALDVKYAFYKDKTGYYGKDAFFESDGAVHGLGYVNGAAITSGAQYKATDRLVARLGYKYSTHIVPNTPTFELTSSSLRHAVGGGATFDATKSISFSGAFVVSWALPIHGEMTSPINNQPIAGSHMRLTLVEYAPSIGISFKY
jgi:long-chain fatty acid transport protein